MEYEEALRELRREYSRATKFFPPFRSPHEGYAIIKEEMDELWGEIKTKYLVRRSHTAAMKREAIHLGAMVLRFLIDIIDEGERKMKDEATKY